MLYYFSIMQDIIVLIIIIINKKMSSMVYEWGSRLCTYTMTNIQACVHFDQLVWVARARHVLPLWVGKLR